MNLLKWLSEYRLKRTKERFEELDAKFQASGYQGKLELLCAWLDLGQQTGRFTWLVGLGMHIVTYFYYDQKREGFFWASFIHDAEYGDSPYAYGDRLETAERRYLEVVARLRPEETESKSLGERLGQETRNVLAATSVPSAV